MWLFYKNSYYKNKCDSELDFSTDTPLLQEEELMPKALKVPLFLL